MYVYSYRLLKMTSVAENTKDKGQEDPIRCIFFSEFHPVAGPKITCQVGKCYTFILNTILFFFIINIFVCNLLKTFSIMIYIFY